MLRTFEHGLIAGNEVLVYRAAAGGALLFYQFDAAALLLSLASVSLMFGGLPLLKRTWPAIAFLIFMVPLPYELDQLPDLAYTDLDGAFHSFVRKQVQEELETKIIGRVILGGVRKRLPLILLMVIAG